MDIGVNFLFYNYWNYLEMETSEDSKNSFCRSGHFNIVGYLLQPDGVVRLYI